MKNWSRTLRKQYMVLITNDKGDLFMIKVLANPVNAKEEIRDYVKDYFGQGVTFAYEEVEE